MAEPKTGSKARRAAPFEIAGQQLAAGRRHTLELPVARLPTGTAVSLPVAVVHGSRPGPRLWVCAAIHGDELNGVQIIARLLTSLRPRSLAGTVVAVPIVNVFGFVTQSRTLPDRRDLNRCFPGSPRGSLASRLAHLFMTEVVARCDVGLDLHTGSNHRANLPQVRFDNDDMLALAKVFGAPAVIRSPLREGSLRAAARRQGCRTLVYESGEALRMDRPYVEIGLQGVRRVMAHLGMLPDDPPPPPAPTPPLEASRSRWVRAPRSGLLDLHADLGTWLAAGESVGSVLDTFGKRHTDIVAPFDGVVIGCTRLPLVNRGDAVVHIAEVTGGNPATA